VRRGEIPPRQELDLHGLLKQEAHQLLKSFVVQARRDGERCILIVTGKGQHSLGGHSVLKEAVPDWLSKSPMNTHLLAFCPAQSQDGGDGAIYVLLRKFP
jgi:DNA-nicking Smr family endonuclease